MAKSELFSTRIDLPIEIREKIIRLLNQHLSDTFDLYSQTKQAHWNVKGPQFFQLHELFDKLAEEVEDQVDLLAERATSLGGRARGTARMAGAASRLPEYPTEATTGRQHLEALADRFAALAATTRAAIDAASKLGDASTADLFTEISRALDKALWFLESHIQE
jgi:starvation-inducible DNA-binding protein